MKIVLPIVLLIIASLSQAQTVLITDGNSLANGLRVLDRIINGNSVTTKEGDTAVAAASYVHGFLGACGTWEILGTNSPFRLPKTGVEPIQAIKIVEKWLNDHPEELHAPAAALCYIALTKAFPNPDFQQPDYEKRRSDSGD